MKRERSISVEEPPGAQPMEAITSPTEDGRYRRPPRPNPVCIELSQERRCSEPGATVRVRNHPSIKERQRIDRALARAGGRKVPSQLSCRNSVRLDGKAVLTIRSTTELKASARFTPSVFFTGYHDKIYLVHRKIVSSF